MGVVAWRPRIDWVGYERRVEGARRRGGEGSVGS